MNYELIEHLARSNVLDVYDAWSHERGCRVILKRLRPDRAGDAAAAKALLREGLLLKRLAHPHLVRCYDVLDDAIVLETLRGETVAHLIERRARRLPEPEVAFLGLHLCSAVGYLHAQNILHLDLKPSNVIAEPSGRAVVIDLSVAQKPGRIRPETGTWCYLAPEQVDGEEVGPAADVWGLGGVLYETASAECAFDDDDDDDPYPQLHRRAEPVRSLRRGLTRAFADTIDGCLEPRPEDRPTLSEVAHACAVAAGLPEAERRLVSGEAAPAPGTGRPIARRSA